MYDVVIVGCGVVGAAAAFALSKYRLRVAVLEKENDVATGATKANSAILHAGYDPKPGTLMAKLNVRGSELTRALCEKLDVPCRVCGSLVVALREEDLETLRTLYEQGVQNGVPGLRLLSGPEARAMEPALAEETVGALYAPTAAVCSPWELCLALAETAVQNGVELYRQRAVTGLEKTEAGWRVKTADGDLEARFVVNAAGVYSQAVHEMAAPHSFTVLPARGEYYLLDKSEGNRVGHVIFQCPGAAGKGVLVAPTVHGNLLTGPNSVACAPQDTNNSRTGLDDVRKTAARSVPGVNFRESIRNFAGVRANTDAGDFVIGMAAPGFLDLAGICSPGLTAATAIGEYAVELLSGAGLPTEEKPDFHCERRRLRFKELSPDERARLVAEQPAYGRVICRCETVTEGEILAALHTPIPPVSVDGVKRRVNAGMGRCQGGFCGPRVVELLARELGISPGDVLQDTAGSRLLTGKTKGEVPECTN